MRYALVIFFTIFIFLYSLLNFYVGIRFIQLIDKITPSFNTKIYWVVFWIVAFSYIAGRMLRNYLSYSISNILTFIGSYWLGILFYSVIIFALIDLITLLDKWLRFVPEDIRNNARIGQFIGFTVLTLLVGLITYGSVNAKNPKIVQYDVNINKAAGKIKSLRIVALSDIHLGFIINEKQIQKAANIINQLEPDLVLFVGDTVDEDINVFKEKDMVKIFGGINAKYGKYAILGNHEYIGGHLDEAIYYIEKSGIKVLKDNYININDSFYIVGRDDTYQRRIGQNNAIELKNILKDLDMTRPIILLDHQPSRISEAEQDGVDLQISGHTHKGQMFPNEFITNMLFENDWGHLNRGNYNCIVSAGFGTWGPPIRIGTNSEILDIRVNFE